MDHALTLTTFQLIWSALWGTLHVRVRKARRYAAGKRATTGSDTVYRRLNPLLFSTQLAVSVSCLWSNEAWLLPFHSLVELRWLGATLLAFSLWLTSYALRHLGDNYSPCYDSHQPHALVTTGPYAFIRHPMYLAKLLAGAGTLLFSGSLWLLPSALYLCVSTVRALRREEAELVESMPGYIAYVTRTRLLIPYWL